MAIEQRTLKCSNPVLWRNGATRQGGLKTAPAWDLPTETAADRAGAGLEPTPQRRSHPDLPPLVTGNLLTLDAVVGRAAAALAVAATATLLMWALEPAWVLIGYQLACGFGLVAVLLTVAQRRRKRPSPTFTFTFAVCEGGFLAVLSGTAAMHTSSGAFTQVVLGTMTASAGVLLAYRLRLIRMVRRFRGYAVAAGLGVALLAAADWLVALLAGRGCLGILDGGPWAANALCGLGGILLAVPSLSIHIQRIEGVINQGVPARTSWTAAFGLTLTLVWLYVDGLRACTLGDAEELGFF